MRQQECTEKLFHKNLTDTTTMHALTDLTTLLRYYILLSTTAAGSGHPSSSLSAVELMAMLMFGGHFRYDLDRPDFPNNDRLIFSKGHAAPLFYALWAAAGKITASELQELRTFDSVLEGHPTMRFPYTEAATGSLGQGLSVGVGMAINGKYLDKSPYRTFVLLGDSEMAEGSNWEAIQLATHYKLDNLIGIIDVNRLGQRGETMLGHDVEAYARRVAAFGWETIIVDGHDLDDIDHAYQRAAHTHDKPVMIIAKTIKGKGVELLEDQEGCHGKALSREQFEEVVGSNQWTVDSGQCTANSGQWTVDSRQWTADSQGAVDWSQLIAKPERAGINESQNVDQSTIAESQVTFPGSEITYALGDRVATRQAYSEALVAVGADHPEVVVLDAETSNSTFADKFSQQFPERFFEMFIAEQNMVSTAVGLSARGKHPFISTFAAFFSRAFDQLRMASYSSASIVCVGSHAGVSIGQDGASQMGLEDLALFRSLFESVVLYPSDAVSTAALVHRLATHTGLSYLRTTRAATPVLYDQSEDFVISGSKTLFQSEVDEVTVVAAGITVHEAITAYHLLQEEGMVIRVIDMYSIKPIDQRTLQQAARETREIIVVEDHYPEGGLGDAVMQALAATPTKIHHLAVRRMPRSGEAQELLEYEEISADAIAEKVRDIFKTLN